MPKFGLPKAEGYPIDVFTILFIFENDNKAVSEWFLVRFTAIQTFIQNEHMRFGVKRGRASLRFAHENFSKEKKRKKKAVC